ncbi:MAG TPA: 23S rRNA (adenine(2503)-C(2))-methyltransferase RlmN [Thermotogota bacterium]|nr:23S rRNA (adenine(2503)-C(2))-methyltransferase RlmN [Thermotogota bacterium]HPJ87999.1 23S rRNA (adenine(2503)-C(2))-methyltransferase RlmN [Thermotogota bacterium]HPR95086.1 23S rRNA (adenine(2503)-C(2))-methyltransferase RlmN [Thermotogota bacterium]
MIDLLELNLSELQRLFEENGIQKFRAKQVINWIYQKNCYDFGKMSNLSKEFRVQLQRDYYVGLPELAEKQVSKVDGTRKYLWNLDDSEQIESVLLLHPKRVTACISTQVGCKLNCAFCATGKGGFTRNLRVSEIIGQLLAMEKEYGEKITNVVFMGMGEPMLNYNSVKKSIEMINDKEMLNLSRRRIAVSTAGILPGIQKMSEDFPEVVLSVSLHAPDNRIREQLMPINQHYSFQELIQSIKKYNEITSKRVTIEYILIKDVNDSRENARTLAKNLKTLKVNINLIPINPVEGEFERPNPKHINDFKEILEKNGFETVVRQEKGTDISGACGQLRGKK